MKKTKGILILVLVSLFFLFSCDRISLEKYTVSATVVKNHNGEYDVANVVIGKVHVDIPIYVDNYYDPDSAILPARAEPVKDAVVKIGSISIPMTGAGIYTKRDMHLEYKRSYPLSITVGDTFHMSSEAVVPDSFSIITPSNGDTMDIHGVEVTWHKSDSANFYIVYVDYSEDTAAEVNGYENVVKDTSVLLPDSCFTNLDGNIVEGSYIVKVIAVNGAWKRGVLSFILGGGNIDGAWGTYAIMTPSTNTVRFFVKNTKRK